MPSLTMTIDRIEQPKEGKPSGKIIGTNGESIGAFQNKLGKFVPGRTYEIDYSTKEWNGRVFKNLEGATEVEASKVVQMPTPVATAAPYVNKDEQIFVCALLKELIAAGHVKYDKGELWEATKTLRGLWGATFGERSTFHASEASRVARG